MCVCAKTKESLGVTPALFSFNSDVFSRGQSSMMLPCSAGDWSRFAYPVQRSYGISVDEWSDQPLVPAQLLTFGKGLMHLADTSVRRHVDSIVAFDLEILAPFPLEDPEAPVVLTCILRKWYPRPACGTAFSSVHPILSVSGLVPAQDEPVECLPWTRRTGVCLSLSPMPGDARAQSGRRWPRPRELRFLSHFWNSKLAHAFT